MTIQRIQADSHEWDEVVRSMSGHNVYQSAAYHRLAAKMDGGIPHLFCYDEGEHRIAIPLLIREIASAGGSNAAVLCDATSVYGYPGILSNVHQPSPDFIWRFQAALHAEMKRAEVVTVFARLGVFDTGIELLGGLGDVETIGNTVAIDLSDCNENRMAGYRRNHRTNISQLRTQGALTSENTSEEALAEFEETYRQSMRRVHANEWFVFGLPYFRELCSQHPAETVLLQTKIDGEPACSGLFLCNGEIAYAHLTATNEPWVGRSPTKVLFDDAATYFRNRGCRWLHIGGGLGAREDSLYRFKLGFSRSTFPFHVWKYVVDIGRYQTLCRSVNGTVVDEKHECFFPQYRAGSLVSAQYR